MGDGGRGEPEPFDGGGDVAPEFVAAAFTQLDAALDVLQELRWSALSAAAVRATVRAVTARQGASWRRRGSVVWWRSTPGMTWCPGPGRGRRRWRSRNTPW